jgi:hypothetical protein
MTRQSGVRLLIVAFVVIVVGWIASNTYWDDVTVPTPLRGEAAHNPFYAAQLFVTRLGATPIRDDVLTTPPSSAVLVLSNWTWDLGNTRKRQLQQWVESGGRLVVDESLTANSSAFSEWSGIQFERAEIRKKAAGGESKAEGAGEDAQVDADAARCHSFMQRGESPIRNEDSARSYSICNVAPANILKATRKTSWTLSDASGVRAMRVRVGRGSVTAIRAYPFISRAFLEGDHADLFVAATQLRGGDQIHFLTESRYPSLLALTWRYGAPAVVLALSWLLLSLWRGGARFGPLAASVSASRRSLAEQIRGTGQFAMRFGGGQALHAAMVRAVEEAAMSRIPGFARMAHTQRIDAIAKAGASDVTAIASALHLAELRRPRELRSAIALLEAARREILSGKRDSSHGN